MASEVDPAVNKPSLYQSLLVTVGDLRKNAPEALAHPRVAIVCGSGLGGLVHSVDKSPQFSIPYEDIPGFPRSRVQGHEGRLVFGLVGPNKMPVVLLVGRAHFYEGHSMELVTYATRFCKVLGVDTMIVTNAAGSLRKDFAVGDVMLLNDHLNLGGLVGMNPLRGLNLDEFGVRFPPLSDAYDLVLRRYVHQAWKRLDLGAGQRRLHEGVYAFVSGPSYETRAECRMLRTLGADVVGMSTVPEVVVARHSGMRVLAMSVCTNNTVADESTRGDDPDIQNLLPSELDEYMGKGKANHNEVLEVVNATAESTERLFNEVLISISREE